MRIRDAVPDDLPALVALLDDDVHSRGREDPSLPLDPAYRAAFDAVSADPNQRLIVAELDGRLIGTLQLSFIPGVAFRGGWRAQIEAVRIASDLRGGGLGRQLIDWAVGQARARGCRFAQLVSMNDRVAAHRFYTRLGWQQSHLGFKLPLD